MTSWAAARPALPGFQAFYDEANRALEGRRADPALRFYHPDFQLVDSQGEQHPLEDLRQDLAKLVKSRKLHLSTKVVEVFAEGPRATVWVREHAEVESLHWLTGRLSKISRDDLAQDTWVRDPQGWRLQQSTIMSLDLREGGQTTHRQTGYVRVLRKAGRALALETAVGRFLSPSGQSLDLVAAVHLGERPYYQGLNREFAGYSAVCYELIAPHTIQDERGRQVRPIPIPSDEADNPLSGVQMYLTRLLGLTFQLNEIDYFPDNFVHADLSPDELVRSMARRGESPQKMVAQLLRESLNQSTDISPTDALALDVALARASVRPPSLAEQLLIRRVFATSFQNFEKLTTSFAGPDGSSLIQVRNQRALEVAQKLLRQGKKRVAVFYGAGHMLDMEQRLLKAGFRKRRVDYLKAWKLADL